MLGYIDNIWSIAGNVRAVVCSSQCQYINDALAERNIWQLETQCCNDIDKPVSLHADMLMCYLGNGQAICHQSQKKLTDELTKLGLKISIGKSKLKKKYPHDIAYDFLLTEKYGFGNLKHTDKNILEYCAENEIKTVDVKQGYAKCSCLVVDGNSIITADIAIAQAAEQCEIDVLLISPGQIDLPGYNHGFIGGCAGYIAKDTIAFTGDITRHSDFAKIDEFISKRGKKYICLSQNKLIDIGGIIPIIEEY